MTRARVAALALVNWKGVFYERYLLDQHVTALEGANGAGKTTVMIAAYVVLLPDMTRLRFTNLGESGATGGDRGIWGRLGEAGRPSYAALDLDLDGERVVLGVRLTRSSEPTVELTPFVITNLAPARALSEILLMRRDDGDHIPDMDELKGAVTGAGAAIEVFRSAKDYFSALFERGITPLRLTGEAERAKWNDLLRTSMTGGISRALGTELRGFLLREETGLAGTLARMRDNLDACRRTRIEVLESRQLEREISATYEAGQAMFAAALHAARVADAEARQRVRQAAERSESAARHLTELTEKRQLLAAEEIALSERAEHTRSVMMRLTEARERAGVALLCARRLDELETECAALERQAALVRETQQRAADDRVSLKAARARALEAYDRASLGLMNRQQGLDELNLRARAYRQLTRRLEEARAGLEQPTLRAQDAAAAIAELDARRVQLDSERSQLERSGRDLAERQREFARAGILLGELAASPLFATTPLDRDVGAHAQARVLLARCSELELGSEQLPRLEREQSEAQRLASKQQEARKLALSLGLQVDEPDAADALADALNDAETELQTLERNQRGVPQADAARLALTTAHERLAQLELAHARYRTVQEAVARLGSQEPLDTLTALLTLRDRLVSEQQELQQRGTRLESERDALQLQAAEMTRGGAVHDVELLRLRDELGAELLASRFDDLDPAQAAWVEARLGPLVHALVVEEPADAVTALAKTPHSLEAVHLVRAGALLELTLSAAEGGEASLVCEELYGVRVVRVPTQPTLGRRAREAKLAELNAQISQHTAEIERLADLRAQQASRRRDSEVLLAQSELLLAGDPNSQRVQLEAEIADLERQERAEREREQRQRAQIAALKPRIKSLRKLLPDAGLLPAPDYAERARTLVQSRLELSAARGELARLASTRTELSSLLDVLRTPPPDAQTLAHMQTRTQALDVQLERMRSTRAALEEAHELQHAEGFADAPGVLAAEQALSPALEAQHAAARSDLSNTERAESEALASWESATTERQGAEAKLSAAVAHRERAAAELAQLGGLPTELTRETEGRELAYASVQLSQLEAAARASVAERALCEERAERSQQELAAARAHHAAVSGAAEPLESAWSSLKTASDAAGVLHHALGQPPNSGLSSMQLTAEASSKRQILLDRVQRSRGADELATVITQAPDAGIGYLHVWQAVRAWLGRRVPAHVAEVMDPLLALERLRDHLQNLESRLGRQEGDLRGSSEDVARGIEVQLRRAHSQVRRLNQQLEGIHFGSVHGIRIELRRIERMDQILKALREGQAQDLLFSASMPIEEALDEIFKRYAGDGRGGRGAGQRLLDYREYVELAVEVRRQTAAAWEPANPTRLSTGEAIGVGAALMMVVLTQWEWDANLLRPRGALGSIRFLFLDEANRLSRDNLGVLFDLCRTLELQLLVAAPEVARADGNTTYRLVRHTTDNGHEEVIVSGRRAIPETQSHAETEVSDAPEVPEVPAEPVVTAETDATDVSDAPAEVQLAIVDVENVC